jgi:Uma2 family endonuclease
MGETGIHVLAIIQLFEVFHDHLPATEFIAADMFWYWEEGHPESRVAPDVMVVKGVGRAHRRSFFTWRENGAVPCIVFEMASQNTWREDLRQKRRLYERLGVREYILFDPEGEYLRPRLQGFRLVEGRYEPIEADADDRLRSDELGFLLGAEDLVLRLYDGTTGAPVPTRQERVEAERLHAEQERLHAEQERLHAEQERRRADALAAEVERLKALLEQARGGVDGGSAE